MSVSVVIPCYNGERFIAEAVRSALDQTLRPAEVLVVDDGSTDDSAAVISSFGSPVRLIQQPNQGESVARNRGIDESSGDWVAFLDADDAWMPTKLERQVTSATAGDVACVTNVRFFGDEDYDAARWTENPDRMCSLEYICDLNAFIPSTLIVRRDIGARFPVWTQHGEDYVFTLEVCSRGSVAFVDEPLTRYRVHRKGQSSHPATLVRQDRTIRKWLADHASELGAERVASIRRRQLDLLVDRARKSRQARKLEAARLTRDYVREFAATHAGVRAFLTEPLYPAFVYRAIDSIDASPIGRILRRPR